MNTKNNETSVVPADGVFVAIGHKPNTDLFKDVLIMDETGYIQTIGKPAIQILMEFLHAVMHKIAYIAKQLLPLEVDAWLLLMPNVG